MKLQLFFSSPTSMTEVDLDVVPRANEIVMYQSQMYTVDYVWHDLDLNMVKIILKKQAKHENRGELNF